MPREGVKGGRATADAEASPVQALQAQPREPSFLVVACLCLFHGAAEAAQTVCKDAPSSVELIELLM